MISPDSPTGLSTLVEKLAGVCDIERIIARICLNRAGPRDLASLGKCLRSLPDLFTALGTFPQHNAIAPELLALREFAAEQAAYIESAILPDPEPHLREGGVVRPPGCGP